MYQLFAQDKVTWQTTILAIVLIGSCYATYCFLLHTVPNSAPIFLPIVILILIGWLMLLRLNDVWAWRQFFWIVIGLLSMVGIIQLISHIPKSALLDKELLWYGCTVVLLISPLLFGITAAGATSWLHILGISFQPSELAKITFLLFLICWLKKEKKKLRTIFVLILQVVSVILILVQQVDLGAALIFYSVFIVVMYLSTGKRIWPIFGLLSIGVAGIIAYTRFYHVKVRVANWINPWYAPEAGGYQLIQALNAYASGGWFGTGLGNGKPYMIPAAHTDFIFAVIGEQLGYIGCSLVIGAYITLLLLACKRCISIQSKGSFLLASGLLFFIILQMMVIIGGVTKFIPLTGVTLPFVSYGGSSLLTSFCALALILYLANQQGEIVALQKAKIERIKMTSIVICIFMLCNLFYWQIMQRTALLMQTLELL